MKLLRLGESIVVAHVSKDMVDHFNKRTNYHIDLVKKYMDKIIALHLPEVDGDELIIEKSKHDEGKFKEPEYTPYLHVSWKYKMQGEGKKYEPSKEIADQMNSATFHHVTTHKHHPEYWDPSITQECLNTQDRDKPGKLVDATRMPLTHVASMVADWLAMSEEKNTNPFDWAKNNVNIRWRFTDEQSDLIYKILKAIWK